MKIFVEIVIWPLLISINPVQISIHQLQIQEQHTSSGIWVFKWRGPQNKTEIALSTTEAELIILGSKTKVHCWVFEVFYFIHYILCSLCM